MEEEISIKELIETLLRRKFMIMGITAVFVLLAGIYSFYIAKPVYEAETKILLSDVKASAIQNSGIEGVIDSSAGYVGFNMASYQEQVKNPEVVEKVIEELALQDKYSVNFLIGKISTETIKKTNVMKIKVKDKDPQLAADIANSVAKNFSLFVTEITEKQVDKSLKYLDEQTNEASEKLEKVMLEKQEFLKQSRSVEELVSEKNLKIETLTGNKKELEDLEINIKILEAKLNETQNQLASTGKLITTKRSISDDVVLQNYVQDKGTKIADGNIEMESERINPIYLDLSQKVADTKISLAQFRVKKTSLEKLASKMSNDLDNLQLELAEKQYKTDLMNQKVNTERNKYNSFSLKNEEIRIAQSSKVGESAVVVSSKAYPSNRPVAPRKMLNLAIAGILGIMIGVFLAFFIEMWREEPKKIEK